MGCGKEDERHTRKSGSERNDGHWLLNVPTGRIEEHRSPLTFAVHQEVVGIGDAVVGPPIAINAPVHAIFSV